MIEKTRLVVIRNTFSVHHMYGTVNAPNSKVEIGHFDGALYTLNTACMEAFDPEHPGPALKWLTKAVFGGTNSGTEFITAKDAHVHVMVALETLINVSE